MLRLFRYKNGEDIKPSEHFVVESLDDGTQRLTVKNATMEDLDEYRCSASNEFGDVWSDVTLTVKSELELVDDSLVRHDRRSDLQESHKKPRRSRRHLSKCLSWKENRPPTSAGPPVTQNPRSSGSRYAFPSDYYGLS